VRATVRLGLIFLGIYVLLFALGFIGLLAAFDGAKAHSTVTLATGVLLVVAAVVRRLRRVCRGLGDRRLPAHRPLPLRQRPADPRHRTRACCRRCSHWHRRYDGARFGVPAPQTYDSAAGASMYTWPSQPAEPAYSYDTAAASPPARLPDAAHVLVRRHGSEHTARADRGASTAARRAACTSVRHAARAAYVAPTVACPPASTPAAPAAPPPFVEAVAPPARGFDVDAGQRVGAGDPTGAEAEPAACGCAAPALAPDPPPRHLAPPVSGSTADDPASAAGRQVFLPELPDA